MEEFRFAMLSISCMLKIYGFASTQKGLGAYMHFKNVLLKTAMNASRTNARKMTFTTSEITIFYTEFFYEKN